MTKQELEKQVARLEFANDQLTTELAYIDELMRLVGFTEGLESLKATAMELCDNTEYNNDEMEE